ncbi:Rossmann-like and DUF2520 domain-containing protein [Arenicella sp. 4NH20-0111]|uniref:Rossmann-like and DUF2520 domain-containing protein n=1 Tax=Arenicella sp. 4NH20-0111 TaxID=3127648 RepID=UPI003102323F
MSSIEHITIIGSGKVGTSLYEAFSAAGFQVELPGKNLAAQKHAVIETDLLLLTVQDSQIRTLCEGLSTTLNSNTIVAHCSGALGSSELSAAKEVGCHVATAHPLNTFPTIESARLLLRNPTHNTHCFISGESEPATTLSWLFKKIGCITHQMKDDSKTAYHTACVFACNYLVSLSELSLQSAENGGLDRDQFWQAIQPLMLSTLENISAHGTSAALSGPVPRGDISTIKAHLTHLDSGRKLTRNLYTLLGQQAVELAADRNELSDSQLAQLKETLS